jgi:hypothetical protein
MKRALRFGVVVVQAQDAATGDQITCDSDLILDLYIAERYLGYNDFRNQLSAAGMDTSTMSDFNRFNYGQYGPLFNTFRNSAGMTSGSTTGMTGSEATQEAGQTDTGMQGGMTFNQPGGQWDPNFTAGVSSIYALDDATFDQNWQSLYGTDVDPATITSLSPSTIAGEAPECTQLRSELSRFQRSLAFQDYSNMNAMMGQSAG